MTSLPSRCRAWSVTLLGIFALGAAIFIGPQAACGAEPPVDVPVDVLEQAAFQAATLFVQDSVVQVETFGGSELVKDQWVASGPSSGTILTTDGWIITSTFQFRGQPASITVVLSTGERRAAQLVARDYSRELALLKIDVDAPLQAVQASDRSRWQVGQWALALGKTFDPTSASCSVGILSAQGRVWNKAIQTDAKISPQNYGGPLVDLNGKVIGILTPLNPGIVTEGEVEQWYDSGIGFAIPLVDILERLPRLQSGTDIFPGRIGFRWRGNDEYRGPVVLQGVTPGSPAARAGIRAGDTILALGSSPDRTQSIENHSQMRHVLGPLDAGQTLTIRFEREGRERSVECPLVKELPTYREPYLGILLDPLGSGPGATVAGIVPESPAAQSSWAIGDVILSLQGEAIDAEHPLDTRLASLDYRDRVDFVLRDASGQEKSIAVPLQSRPENDLEWEYRWTPPEAAANDPNAANPGGAAQGEAAKGTVQIPLGDLKNKAFAIVPSTYRTDVPHGLLIVYGDAGPQNQTQWTAAWEAFAREHRWIVAVAQSAEEKGWSFEEMEIGLRLQSFLSKNYSIDRRRVALGGIGSGSLLAYVTAMQAPELIRGLWLGNLKVPGRVRIAPCEPFRAIHFFVHGEDKSIDRFVEATRDAGYSVHRSTRPLDSADVSEAPILGPLQRWLRLLEAY